MKAPPTEMLPALRFTVASEPMVPPPVPSLRVEIPAKTSFAIERAPPIASLNMALDPIDPPCRSLMSAVSELALKSPPVPTSMVALPLICPGLPPVPLSLFKIWNVASPWAVTAPEEAIVRLVSLPISPPVLSSVAVSAPERLMLPPTPSVILPPLSIRPSVF